ncbi:MAG TPA: Fe-S cluster assembly ATPase SufC [Candidatus Paceibacterota bacterium]|nr:Fe-S cluster assembly ATPase SufC [Candidatus Paceibacterota bacterium]
MAELRLNKLTVEASGRAIARDITLALSSGQLVVLMGPNGSGKSSFVNAIMGHPRYRLTSGQVLLDDEDVTALATEKKARLGIFLSPQHVPEIAGVTMTNFLHRAHRAVTGEEIPVMEFHARAKAKAEELGIDPAFLRREVNHGFSGGEKKQAEILALALLGAKFALLDEIDSGVDVDAQKRIMGAIERERARGLGVLLITHNAHVADLVAPDRVLLMRAGTIVEEGGKELAERVAREGFESAA